MDELFSSREHVNTLLLVQDNPSRKQAVKDLQHWIVGVSNNSVARAFQTNE